MYQTMRCKHCGSENHWTAECPPRERAVTITGGIKTCEVNIGGVTTKYVSKDDYDALVLVHEALQLSAQQELAKVREESQWRWYKDHIEAIRRRYEAELDLYRVPPGYKRVPCCCACKHSYHMIPA